MNDGTNNARSELRKNLFKSRKLKSKTISIRGTDLEIRQPTIGQSLELGPDMPRKEALFRALVMYCFVPGTDEPVFEEGDRDEVMSWPVEAWFNDLNQALVELTDVDIAAVEGNSGATSSNTT